MVGDIKSRNCKVNKKKIIVFKTISIKLVCVSSLTGHILYQCAQREGFNPLTMHFKLPSISPQAPKGVPLGPMQVVGQPLDPH